MKTHRPVRSVYYKNFAGVASLKALNEGEVDSPLIATGYLAAYGNKDNDDEILIKGCAAKSIQERGPGSSTPRKIAFLAYHKQDVPIGRFTKLQELDAGLYYEAEMDRVPYVQETIVPQMQSKTLNNHSIGYDYIWDRTEYDEARGAYILKEIDLYEGSVLCLGANEFTPFGGFKAYLEQRDDYNDMAIRANMLLKKMPGYQNEMELRTILEKYQSLLDFAAGEIKELTAKMKTPKRIDFKYMADNFKL